MKLFTNRYQEFDTKQGLPVRSTFGAPRWHLPYDLQYHAHLIQPGAWFNKCSDKEFRARYFAMLDKNGFDKIQAELENICVKSGQENLVILCFDDVTKPGVCHRTLFAEYWARYTGERVPELQNLHTRTAFDKLQGSLLD